jgi:hypothetical protein
MINHRLWRLVFRNYAAAITLLLIVVHQAIIASSVYFLAKVVENFGSSGPYGPYLLLYMGAMILPFVPGCLSFVAMQHWENHAHLRITTQLVDAARDKIQLYRSSEQRETFDSAVSRNAFGAVSGYIALTHDFFSLLLNSAFSMVVIGFLLPQELMLGYAISFVAAFAIIRILNGPAQRRSSMLEGQYSDYGNCLSRAWDNATAANRHNYEIWLQDRNRKGSSYYQGMLKLVSLKQAGNVTIAFASLFPTAYLVYSMTSANSAPPALLAIVIVNLTRIFHILNSLGTLIYQMLEWAAVKARLTYLFTVQDMMASPPDLPDAPVGSISVNGKPVASFHSIIREIENAGQGRFTVRGANGTGKSTLLLALKKAYSRSAFYLPASVAGLNWHGGYQHCSTGQRMRAVLEEVCSSSKGLKYLLLDEWDANLDNGNRDQLDGLLTTMSQQFVVVEVRH